MGAFSMARRALLLLPLGLDCSKNEGIIFCLLDMFNMHDMGFQFVVPCIEFKCYYIIVGDKVLS